MKIAVFGTPALAAEIFENIRASDGADIAVAVTMPDAPAGRKKQLQASAVKEWAIANNIPVLQPEKVDAEFAQKLVDEGVELAIVIAYGRIFSAAFLASMPPLWNLHLSLLPKYRGTSPVQAAILAGDAVSGVTAFRICPGMDDGPIVGQSEFSIKNNRADAVHTKIITHGSELLIDLLAKKGAGGTIAEIPQDHTHASFCRKIAKDDGKIDPKNESAQSALRKIRAYYPWPSVWFEWNGKRIKLLGAIPHPSDQEKLTRDKTAPGEFCADKHHLYLGFVDGILEITEIQPEGKRVMSGKEFGKGIR